MGTTEGPLPAERALESARERNAVDEELLGVLRREPLLCAAERVGEQVRVSVQQVRGMSTALAWTSPERARAAGWTGPLLRGTGSETAGLLRGSPVTLVLNMGSGTSLGLQAPMVERLAHSA